MFDSRWRQILALRCSPSVQQVLGGCFSRKDTKFYSGNPKGRYNLQDVSVDEKIILKRILEDVAWIHVALDKDPW